MKNWQKLFLGRGGKILTDDRVNIKGSWIKHAFEI